MTPGWIFGTDDHSYNLGLWQTYSRIYLDNSLYSGIGAPRSHKRSHGTETADHESDLGSVLVERIWEWTAHDSVEEARAYHQAAFEGIALRIQRLLFA